MIKRLVTYFCDPTSQISIYEVNEVLEYAKLAFIFVPSDTHYGEVFQSVLSNTKGYGCLWQIEDEADIKTITQWWCDHELTEAKWKEIGARRVAFRGIPIQHENGKREVFDWILREHHDYENVRAKQVEKWREIEDHHNSPQNDR